MMNEKRIMWYIFSNSSFDDMYIVYCNICYYIIIKIFILDIACGEMLYSETNL